jgi:hypothetical protein
MQHIDQMPAIGDLVVTADVVEVRKRIDAIGTFLKGTLVPHIEAVERTLYVELERMLQNRHSMAPMRREHAEIRRLVAEVTRLNGRLETTPLLVSTRLELQHTLFRLYALLKMHLAEEEAYLQIVNHDADPGAAETLALALDHPGFRGL